MLVHFINYINFGNKYIGKKVIALILWNAFKNICLLDETREPYYKVGNFFYSFQK